MQELQPQIKEIQRKYGKDPQKLQEETLRLYRENKVNPVGGCLPLLIQLPIFIGVYQAVSHLMIPGWQVWLSEGVATQFARPEVQAIFIQPFLGLQLGLATFHQDAATQAWTFAGLTYLILPILSILLQLTQQVMAMPRVMDPQQKAMMQAMLFMPIVFGYIAFTFPMGAVLYWVVSSLVGVVQQYFTSGWGSLANYLKFLPPDNRPLPTAATLVPVTVSASGEGTITAPASERLGFWDVLRPLTEAEAPATTNPATGDTVKLATDDAIEEARQQGRPQQNPRRPRKRR
jgi:YidC/Oxa1 family membrane protein insertase